MIALENIEHVDAYLTFVLQIQAWRTTLNFRNMSIVDKPSVDPDNTHFPDIVADVDEGTVSIFIFLIFVLFTLAVGVSSYKCCLYLCVALS